MSVQKKVDQMFLENKLKHQNKIEDKLNFKKEDLKQIVKN